MANSRFSSLNECKAPTYLKDAVKLVVSIKEDENLTPEERFLLTGDLYDHVKKSYDVNAAVWVAMKVSKITEGKRNILPGWLAKLMIQKGSTVTSIYRGLVPVA
jgi:hypothetical protein